MIEQQYPDEYARKRRITNLDQVKESARWRDSIEHIYLPEDKERGIFIQNDGYMDKVLESTDNIPAEAVSYTHLASWRFPSASTEALARFPLSSAHSMPVSTTITSQLYFRATLLILAIHLSLIHIYHLM